MPVKTNNFDFIFFLILALIFSGCESNQTSEVKEKPQPTSISQATAVEVDETRARIPRSFDSLFVEYPIENELQYFELLSHKRNDAIMDPEIRDYDDYMIYKISRDRTMVLEYDIQTKTNKLFSSLDAVVGPTLKLEANNAEFEKLTMPMNGSKGIFHFDRVRGAEIYERETSGFNKIWSYSFKMHSILPQEFIYYNLIEERIERFNKDKETGLFTIQTIDFYSSEIKKAELNHQADRLMFFAGANLYASKFEDYFLLHVQIPSVLEEKDLYKYKLPHYPQEISFYNPELASLKNLSSKFGYEIDKPAKNGFQSENLDYLTGIYSHVGGVKYFQIIEDDIMVRSISLAENEASTSRLFSTPNYVGLLTYENSKQSSGDNEPPIYNIRLLIQSIESEELFEISLPEFLQFEVDLVTIGDRLYLFNKDRYYICNLGL